MMAKEEQRVVNHNFRTTEAEDALIRQKMQAYGIKNQSAFYRAIALNGYMLKLDLPEIREMIRLLLGLAAFVTSIASSVLGLTVGLFALLGVVEFAIGYWQNGIAFMALALLASPIGLPMVADFLLNRMDHILGFFEGKLC